MENNHSDLEALQLFSTLPLLIILIEVNCCLISLPVYFSGLCFKAYLGFASCGESDCVFRVIIIFFTQSPLYCSS